VPRAFWHRTLYRRVFYTGPTGYDPEYRDLRLGTYVLARMAERLCGQADWLKFGLGDPEYKRHFGDQSWEADDVLIFARRPRPVAVNLTRSGVLAASRAGRTALAASGHLDAVRRRWRARLAGRPE
jgi:CelD/BcsL family acetyltransferase involved in cellulose biosynthesis